MDKMKILLVDDNEADVLLIEESCKNLPNPVTINSVFDGEQAINYVKMKDSSGLGNLPDIILLDINMPKVNGLEVLKFIKQESALAKIPVIMLSTSNSGNDVNDCYSFGANSYVVKPIDLNLFNEMLKCITRYWGTTVVLPKAMAS